MFKVVIARRVLFKSLPLRRAASSIWFRFALSYVALFSLTLLLLMLLTLWLGERYLIAQLDARVAAESRFLLFEYEEGGLAELLEEIEERLDRRTANAPLIYSLKNAAGERIFDELDAAASLGWQTVAAQAGGSASRLYSTALADGYVFTVGARLTSVADFAQALRQVGVWVFAVALVVSLVTGLLFARYYAAHIQHVIQGLRQVASGCFNHRIEPKTRTYEFVQLGDELNRMLGQLQKLMANLQQISTGLAHDLRTPLAIVSNHIADAKLTANPESLAALKKTDLEINNILEHFDQALLLAEVESGSLLDLFVDCDLSQLTGDMLEAYEPLFEERGISVRKQLAPGLVLHGVPSLISRVLSNIFDNVIAHSGEGAELSLSLYRDNTQYCLQVVSCYSGEGQVVVSGNGQHAGLGLKIIAAIVALHQGKLSTDRTSSKQGQQSVFQYQLTLPAERGKQANV